MSLLRTLTNDLRRMRVTNTTDTSFPSRIPTITTPDGYGAGATQVAGSVTQSVWDLSANTLAGATDQNRALIVPFGAGADTTTFSMRIIGWKRAYDRQGDDPNELIW